MHIGVLPPACLALSLLLAGSFAAANEDENAASKSSTNVGTTDTRRGRNDAHLTPEHRIRDILKHPAFAGFGRRILPWDGRGRGQPVFHEIYTRAQKQDQPAREHTGLFFFRGKPGAPFAVIAPGGGFAYVGSVHEGFPYAAEISDQGYNAFVLKYRAGYGGGVATQDMAAAISYIIRNATTLGVSSGDYSVWGSSAGARMAAAIGSHGVANFGGDQVPKPSAVVMAYTAHAELFVERASHICRGR